jgi:mono/diheme cytochrome c family protein
MQVAVMGVRRRVGAGLAIAVGSAVTIGARSGAETPGRIQPSEGARLYSVTCQACHQVSGQGLANQFPPLAGSDWVTGSEERLVLIILHGIVGEIEVEGESFNGAMPTWGPTFTDGDVAAVATYVRSAWGNKAAPVAPSTVTRVRLAFASRKTPWTAAELQKALKK